MKQLILIIIITLGLQSCWTSSFKPKHWIIVDIEEGTKHYCMYELETIGFNTYFYAPCNQHLIGDTIYLTKNKQ